MGTPSSPGHGESVWRPGPGAPALGCAGSHPASPYPLVIWPQEDGGDVFMASPSTRPGACTGVSQETDGKTLSLLGEGHLPSAVNVKQGAAPRVAPRCILRSLGALGAPSPQAPHHLERQNLPGKEEPPSSCCDRCLASTLFFKILTLLRLPTRPTWGAWTSQLCLEQSPGASIPWGAGCEGC